jgi:hypothetical protein
MAEEDWTPSKVTLGHLQTLTNQRFMMAMELAACHVQEDPAFPAPTEGYVVSFCSILRVGIQCTITSVAPLVALRSLFQHPHAKINEGLTKEVVLPEKRASPLVH